MRSFIAFHRFLSSRISCRKRTVVAVMPVDVVTVVDRSLSPRTKRSTRLRRTRWLKGSCNADAHFGLPDLVYVSWG